MGEADDICAGLLEIFFDANPCLAEKELTQFLPAGLVREQRKLGTPVSGRELQSWDEFTARGQLVRNGYDLRLAKGVPFASTLSGYLSKMVPRAAAPMPSAEPETPGWPAIVTTSWVEVLNLRIV